MPFTLPDNLPDLFADHGLILEDRRVPGRPYNHVPEGFLLHWTGARPRASNPFPAWTTIVHGRNGLPGPLYSIGMGSDGTWRWVTDGYANHAGSGNIAALDAITQGHAPSHKPTAADDTRASGRSGNRELLGVFCETTNGYPLEGVLLERWCLGLAVLCHATDRTAGHIGHHAGYTARKIDWSPTQHARHITLVKEYLGIMSIGFGPRGATSPGFEPGWRMAGRCVPSVHTSHGAWLLFDDGGVSSIPSGLYYGGLNTTPDPLGDPARIEALDGGGYSIVTELGWVYDFPAHRGTGPKAGILRQH